MRTTDDLLEPPLARSEAAERSRECSGETQCPNRSGHRDLVFAFMVWTIGALVFFRSAFGSGFDRIMGNAGDARLQVFGHEHWVQVLRGHESWTNPRFFFPIKGVLGYSDTFILNEVFYAPLRAVGCDEFLAFQWTIVLMSLAGFFAFFTFLRRTLWLSASVCAALSATFVFANAIYIKAGHLQLYSLYWLPVLMLVMLSAANGRRRLVRLGSGFLSGCLLGLLFLSTYYVAWFAVFGTSIFCAGLLALRIRAVGLRACAVALQRHLGAVATSAVGFVLAMIPFATVYLPVLRASGGRTYSDAMLYAARPADVVNLSGTNYLWGPTMRALLSAARLANTEVSLAVTPVLAVAALAFGALSIRGRSAKRRFAADVSIAAAVTLVALILLPVKFGWGSLWRIPWTLVPGAVGIRAIDRVAMLGGLFAVVAVAAGFQSRGAATSSSSRTPRMRRIGVASLLCLFLFEQFNVGENSFVDRSDEINMLTVSAEPPPACGSFYIIDSAPDQVPFYQSSIDAMLISQHFRLPTVNGYSGQFPLGYSLIDPGSPGYVEQVHLWADTHDLRSGLCSYDRATRAWVGPGA